MASNSGSQPLQRASRELAKYDRLSLLRALGGLQLMPENAHSTLRFEFLSHVSACLAAVDGRPPVELKRLDRLCNDQLITGTGIDSMEDPQAYPFVETVSVFGRNFRILSGAFERNSQSATLLGHALWSMAQMRLGVDEQQVVQQATGILIAGLILSDELANRAGLKAGIRIPDGPYRKATVPPKAVFDRLSSAVLFDKTEIQGLLSASGLSKSSLDALLRSDPPVLEEFTPDLSPLLFTPLIEQGTQVIAALPSAVVPAACHAAQSLLCAQGLHKHLARALSEVAWMTAEMALDFTHNRRLAHAPPFPPLQGTQHGLFSLDNGLLLYMVLLSDPMTDFSPTEWLGGGFRCDFDLTTYLSTVLNESALNSLGAEEVFVLIVASTTRNWLMADIGDKASIHLQLALELDQLKTICMAESNHPLRLYRFAKAKEKIEKRGGRIAGWGDLDTFAMYRSNGYSFYMTDEARPDFLIPQVGWGRELREIVQRDWNPHYALYPEQDTFAMVHNYYRDEASPLYAPLQSYLAGAPRILVEGLGKPAWVTAETSSASKGDAADRYFQFVEIVAYWLWQFSPALQKALSGLTAPMLWIQIGVDSTESVSSPFSIKVDTEHGIIQILFTAQMEDFFFASDNCSERQLISEILQAIAKLDGVDANAFEPLPTLLDTYAPIGAKKKILVLDGSWNPDLIQGDLPKARTIQEEPLHDVLDAVGEYLVDKYPFGSIPNDERGALLNEVVGLLFKNLVELVDELSPEGFLEALLARHESLVHETALLKKTLPSQLACFDMDGKLSKELRERMQAFSRANIASRFLVEYAVTARPKGSKSLNRLRYDDLLALSMTLIDFGFTSDYIHYDLTDIPLRVLKSHRLGQRRDALDTALKAYADIFDKKEIAYATSKFTDLWKEEDQTSQSDEPSWRKDVDNAAQHEIGHTVTEILSLVIETINISTPAINRQPKSSLISQLAQRLHWSEDKVESALSFLTLTQRADYLTPPPSYERPEIWPWRFNRRLSLLQKPLLLIESSNSELMWGIRSLNQAGHYLGSLFESGRYRAKSKELKKAFSLIYNDKGKDFNVYVAELLKRNEFTEVEVQVKEIAGMKLKEGGHDLGDIDVVLTDYKKKTIWLLECKDLSTAKTPAELSLEMDNLIRHPQGKSIVAKHTRRLEWFQRNLKSIIQSKGIQSSKHWRVRAAIVVDTDLLAASLVNSPMPIMPARKLIAYLKSGKKSVLKAEI